MHFYIIQQYLVKLFSSVVVFEETEVSERYTNAALFWNVSTICAGIERLLINLQDAQGNKRSENSLSTHVSSQSVDYTLLTDT